MSHDERIELPEPHDKARQLVNLYEAEILGGPPRSFSDVPEGKALIWVVVNDDPLPELAYYVYSEWMFARITRGEDDPEPQPGAVTLGPGHPRPCTWLLLDRALADQLCPGAVRYRQVFEAGLAAEIDLAAHPDNLLPVSRTSRMELRQYAQVLRRYAAELAGEMGTEDAPPRPLLEDPGDRRVAATDLRLLARDLESWAERDWVAIIELSGERQWLDGPLPPMPG